jgi:hypothetical protein
MLAFFLGAATVIVTRTQRAEDHSSRVGDRRGLCSARVDSA